MQYKRKCMYAHVYIQGATRQSSGQAWWLHQPASGARSVSKAGCPGRGAPVLTQSQIEISNIILQDFSNRIIYWRQKAVRGTSRRCDLGQTYIAQALVDSTPQVGWVGVACGWPYITCLDQPGMHGRRARPMHARYIVIQTYSLGTQCFFVWVSYIQGATRQSTLSICFRDVFVSWVSPSAPTFVSPLLGGTLN